MSYVDLFRTRIALVQAFLVANKYDGILISRIDNFAMATGGMRNWVWTAGEHGANSLFVTKGGEAYYAGNTIEQGRATYATVYDGIRALETTAACELSACTGATVSRTSTLPRCGSTRGAMNVTLAGKGCDG